MNEWIKIQVSELKQIFYLTEYWTKNKKKLLLQKRIFQNFAFQY